jgi:phospholipase/carboxylesterase
VVRHPAAWRRREDDPGIRASQKSLEDLIAREGARGIAPRRVVLAGFSQGGAIALQTALRYGERLAGTLALSTYLPLAARSPRRETPRNATRLSSWRTARRIR